MFKKKLILFIALLFLVVTGFGCKGLSQEERASVRPVKLNYWTIYNDTAVLQSLVDQYRKQRPYVNIDIRKVRSDEFDNLFLNALADDVAPDIISVHVRELPKYIGRLVAMPDSVTVSNIYTAGQYFEETVIEPEVINLPNVRYVKSRYVGTVHDDVVYNEQIFGLPLALDSLAVYYNKDLLDKAGIPEAPTDWGEFMEAVQAISRFDTEGNILQSGVALGTGNNIDNAFDIMTLFMVQSGVRMSQNGQVTFSGGLNPQSYGDHPVVKALNFYVDFARPNKDVYSWNEKQNNALEEFVRGKAAFYFGFAYELSTVKARAPQMNLEILPMFQLSEGAGINVANYWIESVVKKSKHQNEAWDFIQFITNPERVKIYTERTRRPTPFRDQIEQQSADILLAPFVENILNSGNWYRGRNYEVAKEAMKNLIERYREPYNGQKQETTYRVELIEAAARIIQQTM
jgi:multiple sugar transport system substrate-binding protein